MSVGRARSTGPAKENMRRIPERAWHHRKWANQLTKQPKERTQSRFKEGYCRGKIKVVLVGRGEVELSSS